MKPWSKADLFGFLTFLIACIYALCTSTKNIGNFIFITSFIFIARGIYNTKINLLQYKNMLCYYRGLLTASTDCWIAWNNELKFIGASKQIKEMFGLKQHINISIQDILQTLEKSDEEQFIIHFQNLQKNGIGFCINVSPIGTENKLQISGARHLINKIETISLWCKNTTDSFTSNKDLQKTISLMQDKIDLLQKTIDLLPIPIWNRDEKLKITYCNKIYANLLKTSPEEIILNNTPLIPGHLFGQGHSLAENAKKTGRTQSISQASLFNGNKMQIDITETQLSNNKFLGYAIDITEKEEAINNLDRLIAAHDEVLESLATAIAIFSQNTKLIFFNSAYQKLHKFEESWLHSKPTYAEILEELRSSRQLPEHADFPAYKREQLKLFTTVTSTTQELIHLPNGKTIRRFASPYPLGGLLFMYQDVTDALSLKRENNTLLSMQKEIIDNLQEGIAIFASNNRLKITNNSYSKMWNLNQNELSDKHITQIFDEKKDVIDFGANWQIFRENTISNLTDRIEKTGEFLKKDGSSVLFSYTPLPDGSHMHSYVNSTDIQKIEQAINEKNAAITLANNLRIDFIKSITSEISEPINVIKGFSELLINEFFGKLNEKQLEYCKYILQFSNNTNKIISELHDIINVDNCTLNISESKSNISQITSEVLSLCKGIINEKKIQITTEIKQEIVVCDKLKLKQIIFHILANTAKNTQEFNNIFLKIYIDDSSINIQVSNISTNNNISLKQKIFRKLRRTKLSDKNDRILNIELALSLPRLIAQECGGNLFIQEFINNAIVIHCSIPHNQKNTSTTTAVA